MVLVHLEQYGFVHRRLYGGDQLLVVPPMRLEVNMASLLMVRLPLKDLPKIEQLQEIRCLGRYLYYFDCDATAFDETYEEMNNCSAGIGRPV